MYMDTDGEVVLREKYKYVHVVTQLIHYEYIQVQG